VYEEGHDIQGEKTDISYMKSLKIPKR